MSHDTILIWGAGAIGGTLGAYLARAGEDVLLVDIVEAHVEAMNRDGLLIEGPVETFRQNVRAARPARCGGQVQARHPGGKGAPYARSRSRAQAASRATMARFSRRKTA